MGFILIIVFRPHYRNRNNNLFMMVFFTFFIFILKSIILIKANILSVSFIAFTNQ